MGKEPAEYRYDDSVFSLVKVSVENDEIRIAQRIAGHQYLSQRT
jgi:hypothetical protein